MLTILTRGLELDLLLSGEIMLDCKRRKLRRNLRLWPETTLASVASSNWFTPPDAQNPDWLIPYAAVSAAIGVEVGDLMYDYGSSLDVAYPAGQQATQASEAADQVLFATNFCGCSTEKVLAAEVNATRRITLMSYGVKTFDCPSQSWKKGDLIGIYSDGVNSPVSQKVDKVTTVDKAIGVCIKSSVGVSVTTVTAYFQAKNYTGQKTAGTTLGDVILNSIVSGDSSLDINGLTAAQGGSISLLGGTSSTSANAGGALNFTGGTPGLTGVGGALVMAGGVGGATSGAGGAISITGGAGTLGSSAGGAVTIAGGAASATNAVGGVVSMTGGAGAGSSAGAAASLVGGLAGATGVGGAVNVTGGAGGATSGTGGAATVTGGAGTGTNAIGGAAALIGGLGMGTQAGGAITITSGAAGATGVAGAVNISVGGATAGAGSAVTITGGNGAGGTAAGGNINLVPGTAVSTGTPGELKVNSVAGTFEVTYTSPLMTTVVPATGTAQPFYIATRAMRVKKAYCSEVTHGTSETIDIIKDASAGAPGGGTSVLTAPMDPHAASNTPVAGTAAALVATVTLAAGDRLSFLTGGTIGAAAGLTITVLLVPC